MNNDLFQVVLLLDHALSLLDLITVGGLPHVVVSHDALDRFPWKLCVCVCVCVGYVIVCANKGVTISNKFGSGGQRVVGWQESHTVIRFQQGQISHTCNMHTIHYVHYTCTCAYIMVYQLLVLTVVRVSACLRCLILRIFAGLRENPFALEDHPQTSWPPL